MFAALNCLISRCIFSQRLLIDAAFYRFQETETAEHSLTDFKMQSLSTREGVWQSFHQELRKNQQEMRHNYDQGELFDWDSRLNHRPILVDCLLTSKKKDKWKLKNVLGAVVKDVTSLFISSLFRTISCNPRLFPFIPPLSLLKNHDVFYEYSHQKTQKS